ncbi:MAG: acetate uptake transporter [Fusobacteriaceae bacterium]
MKDGNRYVRIVVADLSGLGLFGLSMITLIASAYKLGFLSGVSLLVPWAIILGSIAQLIACAIDVKHNNTFGATAFGGYGVFWLAIAFSWMIELGVFGEAMKAASDPKAYGFAYLGYLVFSLVMTVGAVKTNKVLFLIFVLIDFLFIGLTFSSFGIMKHQMHMLAAYSELLISIVGFYGFAGTILNKHLGVELLPLGGPVWVLKK